MLARKIGLFGGSFNPVHLGHLHLAMQVLTTLELHSIRLIPCGVPAFNKPELIDAKHRLAMLQLAVAKHPQLQVDSCELSRQGTSYTIDTVRMIRHMLDAEATQTEPARLYWLLGSDAYAHLEAWQDWQQLLAYVHLIVIHRPEDASTQPLSASLQAWQERYLCQDASQLAQTPCGRILWLEIAALPISSSQVRETLRQGGSVAKLVPASVASYLQTHAIIKSAA